MNSVSEEMFSPEADVGLQGFETREVRKNRALLLSGEDSVVSTKQHCVHRMCLRPAGHTAVSTGRPEHAVLMRSAR